MSRTSVPPRLGGSVGLARPSGRARRPL